MCLKFVDKTYNKTSLKIHCGYKVFKIAQCLDRTGLGFLDESNYKAGLIFPYFHWAFDGSTYGKTPITSVPQHQWLKSTNGHEWHSSRTYKLGFHIFTDKYQAESWAVSHCHHSRYKIYKVLFRDVTTKGRDDFDYLPVVIAREMLVLKPVKVGGKK